MTGPTIGPIIDGIVIQFIAETSAARGKLRSRTSLPTGVIIAPPNPCTTRIAISIGRLSAIPHSAEPPAKISTAAQNTRRAPNRSAIQPLTGMNTARLSRYTVITRLSRSGVSPRLFPIAGIATAIIVESRPSMKKAQPTISGITMRSRGSAAVGNGAPGSLTQSFQNLVRLMIGENGSGGTDQNVRYCLNLDVTTTLSCRGRPQGGARHP